MGNSGPPTGGRLAEALSSVLADTLTKHKQASAGFDAAQKDKTTTAIMEKMEAEMAPIAGAVLGVFLEHEETPDHLREAISAATSPTHQIDLLLQLIGYGAAVWSGVMTLGAPVVQHSLNTMWSKYQELPLTPEQLATGLIRGIVNPQTAAQEASYSGVNADRFNVLTQLAGEPPGPMDLVALWRRGLIDDARLDHGIRQSRVRDEWIDVYHSLRYQPLSPSEAAGAAVEGHLPYETARSMAASSGVHPEDFDVMFQAAGSPPGVGDIGDLLNRGRWNLDQARAAMRESRVKPKYEDDVLSLREQLPPREAIVLMVERGVVTQDKAVSMAMQLGYNKDNATFLVQEAANRKMAKERDLTKAEVLELYVLGRFDRAQSISWIKDLGYSDTEAGYIIDLQDAQIVRQSINAAISKTRTLYVAYRIDETEVTTALDGLKIRTDIRDQLLHVWRLERDANSKDLTLAQVTKAYTSGYILQDEFLTRLVQMGYSQKDAALLDLLTGMQEGTV